MAYFNSLGTEIPDYLWELGLAVRRLIERYDAMDKWRRHVCDWVKLVREAAEKPNYTGVDVMDLPLAPEIDEEYALLAAVHDNCASPERNEELIHPWAAEADFGGSEKVDVNCEALDAVATYVGLMQHVLPQQGRQRGIERSKADRLLKILRHVANDVRNAARLWTRDRSICADESVPDPVEEYAPFLDKATPGEGAEKKPPESDAPNLGYVVEDVAADLTEGKGGDPEDSQGEQAKQVDEPAAAGEATPEAELNQETHSSHLVGNKIDDPTSPLTAAQIAKAIWGKDDAAARKRAREWMQKGKLPSNMAPTLKDHYVVSKSALELLSSIECEASND